MLRSVVMLALALAVGCSTSPAVRLRGYCKTMWEKAKKSAREPGERPLGNPGDVWKEYACDQKRLPFLIVEQSEVVPHKVRPGDELDQHIVYAMCPSKPAGVIRGNLRTAIYFQGTAVYSELTKNFVVKPGRWSVDAFIKVPVEAEPGVYSVRSTLERRPPRLLSDDSFVVWGEPAE